jgi:hypothetical protein
MGALRDQFLQYMRLKGFADPLTPRRPSPIPTVSGATGSKAISCYEVRQANV